MKTSVGLTAILLLFCFATLSAQEQPISLTSKKLACETTLLGNHNNTYTWNQNEYTHVYSGSRNPCKVFIGVGTSSESETGGLRVDYTVDNTPATTYGVKTGDIILTLDGVNVGTQTELVRERDKHQQGDAFTLSILRDGNRMDINARFKECSEEEMEEMEELKELKALKNLENLEHLTQLGTSERPILGIYDAEGTDVKGIVIGEIIPGKGAEVAGLKSGDVITTVDGTTIISVGGLHSTLGVHKPGDQVTVIYLRDGQSMESTVTLSADRGYFSYNEKRNPCAPFIGVYVSDATGGEQGVQVTGIVDDTPAKKSDVQAGDVIVELDGMPVNNNVELRRERDKHKAGDAFSLTVRRNGTEMTIDATFKSCPKPDDAPVKTTPEVVKLVPEAAPVQQADNKVTNPDVTLDLVALDLFPNPTIGMLNVRFEAEAVPTTVRISDATGKTVYNKVMNQFSGLFSEQINLEGNAAGTYVLTVQQGKKIISKNVVLLSRV